MRLFAIIMLCAMESWIKLYNKMLDWEWYKDTTVVRVFLHCLLKANYAEKKWCGIVVGRGQFLTSLATMAQELTLSLQQTRTALNKLKSTSEITIKSTNKYTIITICKFDNYQSSEQTNNNQSNNQSNKQTTNKQHANQQTNNNNIRITDIPDISDISDIEKKKISPTGDIKKENPKRFIPPTYQEVKGYCLSRGNSVNVEAFMAYYESNGWCVGRNKKMKDWRGAVRYWEAKDKERGDTARPAQSPAPSPQPRQGRYVGKRWCETEEEARFFEERERLAVEDAARRKEEEERKAREAHDAEIARIRATIYQS